MLLEASALPLAISTVARAQGGPGVSWMWSGNVTGTTATVKARVSGTPSDLHLLISPDSDWSQARRVAPLAPPTADTGRVAAFAIDALQPDTPYFYAVADGERRLAAGEFRTFGDGPLSFQFAFASCSGGNPLLLRSISNHAIFSVIDARRPRFMLHMGDLHYRNIRDNDIRRYRDAYDAVLTRSRPAALFRRTPVVYMWDDHDYGANNSDRTSPSRDAARRAYAEHVPHYPLTWPDGGTATIQQEFSIGRTRFIVSDLRSARDPDDLPDGPSKSMLGEAQRAWLDDAFTRAAADEVPLVFWVSSVPWITGPADTEGWQPYAWERRWLADRLASLGLMERIVMLSGDAHMVAIDDGTHNTFTSGAQPGSRGFPVIQAAPLDRQPNRKGGPYTHGISTRRHQFGWADVQDDGTTVRVTLSGHDEEGRQLPGMRLEVACRGGRCEIVS